MASSLISINEATIEELQQLEGIGPKRSIYIVDFRNRVDLIRNTFDLATATGLSIKAQDGFLPESTGKRMLCSHSVYGLPDLSPSRVSGSLFAVSKRSPRSSSSRHIAITTSSWR